MAGGDSAAHEVDRQRELADEYARLDSIAHQLARTFRAAAHDERRLGRTLLELEPLGWTVLADRRRPGSTAPTVDLLVGPAGVIVVAAMDGGDLRIDRAAVHRGDLDATDEIARIADLVYGLQKQLADVGLAPGEVSGFVALSGSDAPASRMFGLTLAGEAAVIAQIAGRGRRLDARHAADLRSAVERLLPAADAAPVNERERGEAPEREPSELDVAELDVAELGAALRGASALPPVEDWMTLLSPDQARLARRSFSGPARVRGAAGTGKTAVALHRAAYLARTTSGRVLVTSYVRALPRVLAAQMRRLAPDVADRIEFASVHTVALRVLTQRRGPVPVDARAADDVFRALWTRLGPGTPLAALDPAPQYWLEELHHVIKGRGLTTFDAYEALPRAGRRRPLNRDQRAAMWRLYVAYKQELRRRGILDWDDLVLEAEASLRERPLDRYDAVIVDEAQDLSCAMLRMLHLLVGDRPDGLLLVADGRQSIYPGGYTLAEAGVSVAGRGAVLTTNYRTTAEIAEFASAISHGETALDIEGAPEESAATALRHGPEPVRQTFESHALHDESFVAHVRGIRDAGGRLADIGVLALSNLVAQDAAAALEAAGIPTVELERVDGTPVDAVRVGTIKRAKGLEFTDVLVVRTPLHLVRPLARDADPAVVERRDLQRRELYVAMTRARERVWVGVA